MRYFNSGAVTDLKPEGTSITAESTACAKLPISVTDSMSTADCVGAAEEGCAAEAVEDGVSGEAVCFFLRPNPPKPPIALPRLLPSAPRTL